MEGVVVDVVVVIGEEVQVWWYGYQVIGLGGVIFVVQDQVVVVIEWYVLVQLDIGLYEIGV